MYRASAEEFCSPNYKPRSDKKCVKKSLEAINKKPD